MVCDTRLRPPLTARAVATCCTDEKRRLAYERAGCRVLRVGERDGHVDLDELMARLGRAEIDSVLLEGGGTLNWAALEQGVVQKVQAYIAPKLLGGREAKTPVEGAGVPHPEGAFPAGQHHGRPAGGGLFVGERGDLSCLPGSFENIGQAIEQAGTKAGNKGFYCAVGAIEMVELIRALERGE